MSYRIKSQSARIVLGKIKSKNWLHKFFLNLLYAKYINQLNKKLVSLENNLNVSIRDSANARISKKVVVYTAIFGDYDDLIDQILVSKNFDFIDFSDNKSIADKSKIWQFNEVDSSIFPRESMSRINKTDF